MPSDDPSERLIEQRIRKRIIEQLELAGSFEIQRELEAAAPQVYVPYEVINGWEDWARPDRWPLSGHAGPFSEDEIEAIKTYNRVWESVADEVSDNYPALVEVQSSAEWSRLRDAAVAALVVFAHQGRRSETQEERR